MAIYCQERRVLMEIATPQPKTSAGIRRSYLDALSYRGASTPNLRNNSMPSNQDLYSESSDSSLSDDGFESSLHIGDHSERRQRLAFYFPASEFQVNSSYITEPSLKKQRISNKEEVGLQFQLESLSQQKQLVEVVNSLVILEEEQKTLPFPNLKPLQEELQLKKANVYRSIPYTRLGSNRDAHCYRKACPQLLAFKKTCIGRGQLLLQCNLWESALEFVLNAWRFTSELPQWETSSHNRCKEQCFSALAAQCTTALQQSSIGMKRAIELKRRLKIARTHSKLIIPCIQELDSIIENLQCRTAET
ncbi:uncharacterized protein LOC117405246 isoform X2 [Acipenser ruthenus]|uniref:uncharacterized protein LOC117405246 isoform X2 n=1 Tax=Acipenser ruthenus TaxID=7906 RepID=UPI002740D617|nr:uncharacterized protein LOC117405246 isoform X2 [Acipenser ruthenus]